MYIIVYIYICNLSYRVLTVLKHWIPNTFGRRCWVLQVSLDADSCHEWPPVPRCFVPLFIGFPPSKVQEFSIPSMSHYFSEVG